MSKKTIAAVAVAGSAAALLIAAAVPTIANAATSNHGKPAPSNSAPADTKGQKGHDAGNPGHRDPFASLGLTADQTAKVKAALDAHRDAFRAAHDADMKAAEAKALTGLVTAGTITQAQADAITASTPPDGLRTLVENGTITEAQVHALFDAMRPAKDATPPAAPDAAKSTAEIAGVLAPLVSDGTITQAQADAIAKGFSERRGGPDGGPGRGHGRGPNGQGMTPPAGGPSTPNGASPSSVPSDVPQFDGAGA